MRPIILAAGLVTLAAGFPALAQNVAGSSNLAGLGVTTTGDRPAGTSKGQASNAAYVYNRSNGPWVRVITGNNAPASAKQDVQPGQPAGAPNPGAGHASAGVEPTTASEAPSGANFWVDAGAGKTPVFQRGNVSNNGVSLPNSGVAVPH